MGMEMKMRTIRRLRPRTQSQPFIVSLGAALTYEPFDEFGLAHARKAEL
jgi:hypothetical protein